MPVIYVDADACPVKEEVYRVARRHGLRVTLVSNQFMRTPGEAWIEMVVAEGGIDAADDWIAGHVVERDIVITADIPLASRCLKMDARVISPNGRVFTDENIADAVATRDLLTHLRDHGEVTGGPPPFRKQDRSRFLQRLDETVVAVLGPRRPDSP
jgi:uncharacterized protein YaiI (UPF0178 family)